MAASSTSSQPKTNTNGDNDVDTKQQNNNNNGDSVTEGVEAAAAAAAPDMSLEDITNGKNERGIPAARFIENITLFAQSFQPIPASAELLIGAYTELHTKYKASETNLRQKQEHLKQKVPELEKSLNLVRSLLKKKMDGEVTSSVRYSLADQIYGKATIDSTIGTVHLWLGANVMLEYTYEDAITFLDDKQQRAVIELNNTKDDLSYVRDQIVTCEVNISRIYNWDVRRKRAEMNEKAASVTAATTTTATATATATATTTK